MNLLETILVRLLSTPDTPCSKDERMGFPQKIKLQLRSIPDLALAKDEDPSFTKKLSLVIEADLCAVVNLGLMPIFFASLRN